MTKSPKIGRVLRTAAALAVFAAFPLSLGACASGGEGGGGGAATGGYDQAGSRVGDVGGSAIARVVSVDTSALQTEGKVKYVIENATGTDLEDLLYSVSFHFPPGKVQDEIQVTEEQEASSERPLTLYKNDRQKVIEAVCPNWGGPTRVGKVRGTSLMIQNEPPVPVLPRTATDSGTRLFNNRLECTAIATRDELDAETPRLWVELENTDAQKRKAADLEIQVVFPNGGTRTKWKSVPTIQPGGRVKVDLDLRGVELGDKEFLVKVRPQAL